MTTATGTATMAGTGILCRERAVSELESLVKELMKSEKFSRGEVEAVVASGDAVVLRRVERLAEIAMRCDSDDAHLVASACVSALRRRFGDKSVRVGRLEGMLLESKVKKMKRGRENKKRGGRRR